MTTDWYRNYYENKTAVWEFTKAQISGYTKLGMSREAVWTK